MYVHHKHLNFSLNILTPLRRRKTIPPEKTWIQEKIAQIPIAIAGIRAAGGFASLAHITTYKGWQNKLDSLLTSLTKQGLTHIEAFSSEISTTAHKIIAAAAQKFGLTMTGGSDSHGDNKPYAILGQLWSSMASAYSAVHAWTKDQSHLRGST